MRSIVCRVLGVVGAFVFIVGGAGCAASGERPIRGVAPDFGATYRRHAVAADHHLASEAGLEVLRAGGNAVDAAVATSFALSVVRPFSCGIGGGGFMVVHFADSGEHRETAINYRETAPAAITPDFYERRAAAGDTDASRFGATAAGVPGTVSGLLHAHERFGRLSLEAVMGPAIRLAEAGFKADEAYVRAARTVAGQIERRPGGRERFAFLWERYLRSGTVEVGDLIHVPEQGVALRLIARDGAAAFYEGPIAEAIVRAVRGDGGIMTLEDLRGYRAVDMEPLRFEVAGIGVGEDGEALRFVTMPPPSSGGVAMGQALLLYERGFENEWQTQAAAAMLLNAGMREHWGESYEENPRSPWERGYERARWDRDEILVEAFKLAFADRAAWLGDPAFVDVPVEMLLSSAYLDTRATSLPRFTTRPPEQYLTPEARVELLRDAGTSHLSVVDRWGNAVACTETINTEFGCLLAVPEYGFVLNDQMDDFTTRLGEPNAYGLHQSVRNLPEAGKRPLSSMTPTIVLDDRGRVRIVAGASGGPRIITGTTLALLRAMDGASAREAVASPRYHHQWVPNRLDVEPAMMHAPMGGAGATFAAAMRNLGHEVAERDNLCVVQLIRRDARGFWEAASDPRKGGRPAGD